MQWPPVRAQNNLLLVWNGFPAIVPNCVGYVQVNIFSDVPTVLPIATVGISRAFHHHHLGRKGYKIT